MKLTETEFNIAVTNTGAKPQEAPGTGSEDGREYYVAGEGAERTVFIKDMNGPVPEFYAGKGM